MNKPRDYYEILEVHPRARPEIIEKAYRVLALHYHPDVHPPERRAWAEERMKEINAAYRTLRDPEKRARYDALLGLGRSTAASLADPQIKCFNHPKEPSVAVCSRCQRPICGQCAIEIWERTLCLGCAAAIYAQRHPEAAPTPPPAPAMGLGGLAFFYLLWGLCLWGAGSLAFRLAVPGAVQQSAGLGVLSVAILGVVGGLALWNGTTGGVCRECGTVNTLHDFRRQAPWAEFWQPPPACRACGCLFGAGEIHNRLGKWFRERVPRRPPENDPRS